MRALEEHGKTEHGKEAVEDSGHQFVCDWGEQAEERLGMMEDMSGRWVISEF